MKKLYGFGLVTALVFCTNASHAQQVKDSSATVGLRSFLKIKADLYGEGGLEWEQKINRTSVVNLFTGIALGWGGSDNFLKFKPPFIIVPATFAEYRNYYNLLSRLKNGKKTGNNSANFLFCRIETFLAVKNQNYFNLLFKQGWGIQRSISKKVNFDCHFGIIEHIYYDKPPSGGYRYIKLQPQASCSFMYTL